MAASGTLGTPACPAAVSPVATAWGFAGASPADAARAGTLASPLADLSAANRLITERATSAAEGPGGDARFRLDAAGAAILASLDFAPFGLASWSAVAAAAALTLLAGFVTLVGLPDRFALARAPFAALACSKAVRAATTFLRASLAAFFAAFDVLRAFFHSAFAERKSRLAASARALASAAAAIRSLRPAANLPDADLREGGSRIGRHDGLVR